jgi:capsule polysaccharide export protein KpsE/RkpR
MNEQAELLKLKLSDYLSILIKWKNFIIVNFLVLVTIIITLSLLIENQYRATTVIMITNQNNMMLGGLTSLVSGNSPLALGSKLFGLGGNNSEDRILGILNSRLLLNKVTKQFNLMKYYEIQNKNTDKLLKAFKNDLSFDPNEFGMVEISVINKNPKIAALMANYFVSILDSLYTSFSLTQARDNRLFLENRYLKNVSDLKNAEESMYQFQKKYGIFVVPEQIEVAVKVAAELESKLIETEIKRFNIQELKGINSPEYLLIDDQYQSLKNKIIELKSSNKLSDTSNILFPFKKAPEIVINYYRNYREIEIQTKILEVVLPLYEQAKLEEQKSMPCVQVLDYASPPQEKYSPKRSIIIAGYTSLVLFVLFVLAFWGEKMQKIKEPLNSFDRKMKTVSSSLVKVFKIR